MEEKQTVVIAGATGRVGRLVVNEVLARGFNVRAILVPPFDSSDQPEFSEKNVEMAEGDLTSVEALEKAVEGADYLISVIGSKKPFSKKENDKIDNMGNQNLTRAAKAKGLKRVVIVSSNGVGNSRWAINLMHKLSMNRILRAKEKSEAFIQSQGMEYTLLRPGGYNEKDLSGEIVFGEGGGLSGLIGRGGIAKTCADAITNPAMKNRTLEVMDKAKLKEGKDKYIIEL
jgi:uncharacterized protein YbjT (DUF2867 family)